MLTIENYISCKSCSGKVTPTNKGLGECTKCSSKMKRSKCKDRNVARVVLEEQGKEHKVTMLGEVIKKIIGITKELEEDSDTSGLLFCCYHSKGKLLIQEKRLMFCERDVETT